MILQFDSYTSQSYINFKNKEQISYTGCKGFAKAEF